MNLPNSLTLVRIFLVPLLVVVLLTNDGELTAHLTHPRYEVDKEYRVLVASEPSSEQLAAWRQGVPLDGKRTAPAQVRREDKTPDGYWLRVIMHEGRKREIREIGRALGLKVLRLIRVRLAGLELGRLKPGDWRELTGAEVRRLKGKEQAA